MSYSYSKHVFFLKTNPRHHYNTVTGFLSLIISCLIIISPLKNEIMTNVFVYHVRWSYPMTYSMHYSFSIPHKESKTFYFILSKKHYVALVSKRNRTKFEQEDPQGHILQRQTNQLKYHILKVHFRNVDAPHYDVGNL